MTPRRFARLAKSELRRRGRPAVAASSRRFFKSYHNAAFFGVTTPDLRRLERETFKEIKGTWTVREATEFADLMVVSKELEAKYFGMLTLSRFKKSYDRKLLGVAERWLKQNHCDNWATVDGLCPSVITPLVIAYPDLVPRVQRWSRSRNLWLRRASVVTFVPLARRGESLDEAYEVAVSLLGDKEDLIHKATGWMLREAGRTNRRRLTAFLLERGSRVPRTTVRYAIERYPEAQRKRLLRRTAQ